MTSSSHDGRGTAGQGPATENPFAAPGVPSGPPPSTAHSGPYGSDDPAPIYGHHPDGAGVFPGTEHVDVGAVLGGDGYTGQEPPNHPLAIAAVVLGALGVIPGVGLLGIVCGHVALRRMDTFRDGGRGLAITGLVLGYTLSTLWLLFAVTSWS